MWKQSVFAYIITGSRLYLITSHRDHCMSAIWILRVSSNNPPETIIQFWILSGLVFSIVCDQYVKLKSVNSTTTTFRWTRTHHQKATRCFWVAYISSEAVMQTFMCALNRILVTVVPWRQHQLSHRHQQKCFGHHYLQLFRYSVKAVVRDIFFTEA